ncbi:MAG TPA: regulatory protein RecX [Bacteroidales bacterium]|nr:regulatory protein RecX [Bacteroidales bacterium]
MESNIPGFLMNQIIPKLEKYCAFQERCISEVKLKLSRMNVSREYWDSLLNYLIQNGFVNEERFAELFVRSKIRQKGWGPVKIKMELRKKSIPDLLIDRYISAFQVSDQEELLMGWLQKKLKTIEKDEPLKLREKLIRFGISKGFETGKVFQAVNKLIKAQPED